MTIQHISKILLKKKKHIMNKFRFYSSISLLLVLLLNACYMDVEDYRDCCGLYVDNHSTSRLYVGFYYVSHLLADGTTSPNKETPIWGVIGYVEEKSLSHRLNLPHVNKDSPTYGQFFETYGIDTLFILISDDNKIGHWVENRNDSLLLKRYDLTKDNVDTTKQDVYIKYP